MEEESTTLRLPLALCFKLGRALRYGDVSTFFKIYDSLAPMEDSGVSDATFNLKQATLKETARQISELDTDDYTVLAKATGPLQTCSESVNLFEPVAIQLAQYIDRCRLDDRGSDSGTVSDYEGQGGCDRAESIQYMDFDSSMLSRRSLERTLSNQENLLIEEDMRTRNMTPSPPRWGIDTCKLALQTDDPPDTTTEEDPLCSINPGEEISKLLLEESLRRLMIDDDSSMEFSSAGYLPDGIIDNNLIEVSELEKTFFGTDSDDNFTDSLYSDVNLATASKSEKSELIDFQLHWKSQLHLQGEENWYSSLGYTVYRDLCNRQQPFSKIQERNRKQSRDSKTDDSDTCTSANLSQVLHESEQGIKPTVAENRTIHQESSTKNKTGGLQEFCTEQQCQKSPQQLQQAMSPLALHSRNMWSTQRENTAKPPKTKRQCRNNQRPHRAYRNRNEHFNHHEVVQFLMQGWENAMAESSAHKKARL